MKIARIALLLLVAVCLGGMGYVLATYKRNAAKVRTLATPSTESVDKPDFWKHSPDVWVNQMTERYRFLVKRGGQLIENFSL